MKTKEIYINKENKYLFPEILPVIPPNAILNKTLPGLGATYSEIEFAKRHSIIIEANVPVILGKKEKHTQILGVHEGVYTSDVLDYLKTKKNYYKILTTPESFHKVKKAIEQSGRDMYNSFFLLYDESHKIIQDIQYREAMTFPMDDFFQFKEKAFVSATPIMPKDPRFDKNKFSIINVIPTYDYRKRINLITTNDIVGRIRECLNNSDNEHICIFLNSTDTIQAIIKALKIEKESSIFCARESKVKLESRGMNHIYEMVIPFKMRKFNFFTSRFFTAVDIILDYKPEIIMITDLFYAEHSMLDPNTESIQIIGRFRNGVGRITHVSNINRYIEHKTSEDIAISLIGWREAYNSIQTLYNNATNPDSRFLLLEAMKLVSYNKFIYPDGTENFFAIDNYIDEETVKGYYISWENLLNAYMNSMFFYVTHTHIDMPLGDFERLQRERSNISEKDRNREIVRQLELLEGENGVYPFEEFERLRNDLYSQSPFIVKAYEQLGKELLEKLNYSVKMIKEEMIKRDFQKNGRGLEFTEAIYNFFDVGEKYTLEFIKEHMIRLHEKFEVPVKWKPTAKRINDFFMTKECYLGKRRALKILSRLV